RPVGSLLGVLGRRDLLGDGHPPSTGPVLLSQRRGPGVVPGPDPTGSLRSRDSPLRHAFASATTVGSRPLLPVELATEVGSMGQGIRAGQTISSIPYGFDRYGRPLRIWRRRKDLSLRESFLYPIVDGPGIALLVFLPPFLAIMALPVFDMMVHIKPGNVL